jgi:hypothetical protein
MQQPLDCRKYKRVWKRGEIKKLFEFANGYFQTIGKTIDTFVAEDV